MPLPEFEIESEAANSAETLNKIKSMVLNMMRIKKRCIHLLLMELYLF